MNNKRPPIDHIEDILWRRFSGMKKRCNNINCVSFPKYGGRGIKVLWKDKEDFVKDMRSTFIKHAKRHGYRNTQIERVDNNKSYSNENCKWATPQQQNSNRSSRVEITYRGETKSVFEWADHLKIPRVALWLRLFRYKWGVERAFTQRVRGHKY